MKLAAFFTALGCFWLALGTSSKNDPAATPKPAKSTTAGVELFDHQGHKIPLPQEITFNAHIRGIMSNTCFACHGPDEETNPSGARFDSFETAVEESGAIEPGDSDSSEFYQRIIDEDDPMPPADFLHQLSDYEKALFKKWIDSGAKYEQHWAYAPVHKPSIPLLTEFNELAANPIDHFILARLEREGHSPSPIADKRTLLRRLSLDLIGLPPTLEEMDAFLADDSADAYAKQVDRLMSSLHYGERMSAFWLDIVRFSDTVGFHGDQNQRIFPYRDFVINSLNSNQPFDDFTRDQLAGDLLESPTTEQLTASGLVRLNMVTREGGAQAEEYLAKYTADRVRMLGTAWLGSTTGCCECHNHKYDPFTIEDFYSLGAFFDDVRQWGVYSNYNYTPNKDLLGFTNNFPFPPELRLNSKPLEKQLAYLESKLESEAAKLIDGKSRESEKFNRWLTNIVASSDGNAWQSIKPQLDSPSAKNSAEVLDDNSIRFNGKPAGNQSSRLSLTFDRPSTVRAIQMEVIPDAKHNGHVGRRDNGHFTTALSVFDDQNKTKTENQKVEPRFIRIEMDGPKFLLLNEVEVFAKVDGELVNLASQGKASQSSTRDKMEAKFAIDGLKEEPEPKKKFASQTQKDFDAWWELDLKKQHSLDHIVVWGKTEGNASQRVNGFRLVLLDKNRTPVFVTQPEVSESSTKIEIPALASVDYTPKAKIAFAVANRFTPTDYVSGHPRTYLDSAWKSGPIRWQLPKDETKLPHTATFALDSPLSFAAGESLSLRIDSSDIGRVRFSTSSVARAVAGQAAFSANLLAAVEKLKSLIPDSGEKSFKALNELSPPERNAVLAAYYQSITPFGKEAGVIKSLRADIAECRSGLAMTLITQQVEEEKRRQSRILPRGNWQDKSGEEVSPNTPRFLPSHNDDKSKQLSRLDLAEWITSPENPLTARHYVNRVWAQFFGTGLSNVVDDLGNQGEWPSHPQLLDWLANEFQQGWDRKKIIRLIVTSRTYRQQASIDQKLLTADPYNRLLGQQAARRLEAEIVRDNALAISGLLKKDWIGGPSVFPYQPPGYYANLQFPNRDYSVDTNGLQYRRGVYMHWQRTFLHPMLTNFDAPSRDECVAFRTQSNSPQQALTLLNDPVFVEASRALAVRCFEVSETDKPADWIAAAFQLAVSRSPKTDETAGLLKLYNDQVEYFEANPAEAEKFLRTGQFAANVDLPDAEYAAFSQVCRVVLNLHETITRF